MFLEVLERVRWPAQSVGHLGSLKRQREEELEKKKEKRIAKVDRLNGIMWPEMSS